MEAHVLVVLQIAQFVVILSNALLAKLITLCLPPKHVQSAHFLARLAPH